jgi:hypothetical protein
MSSEITILKSLPGIWVLGRFEIPCQLGIGKKGKDVVLMAESSRMGHHQYSFRLDHIPKFLVQLASLKEQECEHSIGSEGNITFCLINGAITFIFPELEIRGISLAGLVKALEEIQERRNQKGKGGGGTKGEGQLPGHLQSRGFFKARNGGNNR